MIITVVNMSHEIADKDLQPVVRAINRQISEDFEPYWSLGATLRLEGHTGKSATRPDKVGLPELRGDAMLYLWDDVDVKGALGYHAANAKGIPFGFVFTKLAKKLGESWTVTLSHEALELVADPLANLLVSGPHPQEDRTVFHWYEMSDAVQAESYAIDGIEVSNFVLPLYFTPDAETGSRNDFLGNAHGGKTLASFGINPGGYIGFFDPETKEDVTFANADDQKARTRLEVKKAQSIGRRASRLGGWPREQALDQSVATPAARSASPFSAVRGLVQPAAVKQGRRCERIG